MSDSEGGTRYPFKAGPYSSHARVLHALGPGNARQVLDVGCAQGDLSLALGNAGWRVTGIEPYAADADRARAQGIEVIAAPVEKALASLNGPFDAIVAADVLEHLVDPAEVLSRLVDRLSRNGRIVVSLPNVAHLSVRIQLLLGRFDYKPYGIMDVTHVRFFTRRTAISLLREAGLEIESIEPTPVPLERLFPKLGSDPRSRPLHVVNRCLTGLWNRGLAFQFVLVAKASSKDR